MPRLSQPWIVLAVVVFAAGYFVLDVRQRARIDRGIKRHRTDFTVYQYAARALRAGEDPYEATNPRGYRYVYPPLLAITLMPIADWAPENAALVFYLLSLGAFLFALFGLARLRPDATGPPLGWAAVALAALTCLGFAHQGFQRGQITHVLLGLHVGALLALWRGRPGWAGFALAIGGVLRLTPLLLAGAIGVGLLCAIRSRGWKPALLFSGGLGSGLLLGFVLIPVLALGTARAQEVNGRWIEATRAVYAENAEFDEAYKINEWRFKNQAPRRVLGTWLGWSTGATFEKERPQLSPTARAWMDGTATTLMVLLGCLSLLLGALFLRSPADGRYAAVFALITLLPVLMTRYTWPTHYLLALPAVALAAAPLWQGAVMRRTRWVLLGGALLFYAAHAKPLVAIGQFGCLMLAAGVFLVCFLRVALGSPRE